MRIEVYTDGSALNNGSAGSIGYAAVLFAKAQVQEFSGGEACDPASSNRAELLAIILGLEEAFKVDRTEVLVFADGEWAVRSIRGEFQATANEDLIRKARALVRLFSKAEVNWVRGHCGHALNERAHTLAKHQARKALPRTVDDLFQNRKKAQCTLQIQEPTEQEQAEAVALSQTRLNRIWNPTGTYFQNLVKWTNRFNGDPATYTTALLEERLQELEPQLEQMREIVACPPPNMTPSQWETAEDKLRKAEGQFDAIRQVLEKRAKSIHVGSISRPGLMRSTSIQDTESPGQVRTKDPFVTS